MTEEPTVPPSTTRRARVTLEFQSDSSRSYLYDDITGAIFPWNALRESILSLAIANAYDANKEMLEAQYDPQDVDATYRLITKWRENYGAFVRTWSDGDWKPCPPVDQLEALVRSRSFELLLILTEDCNLRCRYCALSEVYPLNRARSARKMSLDTAKAAIDWYVRLVQPQLDRNPRKRFGLSLYGGEPMLNMPVLKGVLEYCRDRYPGVFLYVMTTNGTLLTPQNVELLVEHDVLVAVSFDGPEQQHDRFRLDHRGRGTFATISRNLDWIRKQYPQYWATKMTSVSVYDWGTDLEATEAFFEQNIATLPRSVFVNQVDPHNTDWYAQYADDDQKNISDALQRLTQRFKHAKIHGDTMSHYLNSLVGIGISMVALRTRSGDVRPSYLPFTGSCLPGDKVAIHVDGKIDICERVNGAYPIGHLDRGGIDYRSMRDLINRYRAQVMDACPYCPATRQCNICFSLAEARGGFARDARFCNGTVEGARRRMSDAISIMEANPEVHLAFETDTACFEERRLLQF